MQKSETLEQWIQRIIERPIRNLNAKYSYSRIRDDLEREIEALPCFEGQIRATEHISRETLEKLHQKLRGQKCESRIWEAIVFRIADPLPVPLVTDLINRNIMVCELGHTRQVDEVQWRLAYLVDEALLTFFHDMYTNPAYDVANVEKLLSAFPDHSWLLDKWKYWAQHGSSREKKIVFHRWAWQHPERPADFLNPEKYLNNLIEFEKTQQREAEEEKLRAKRDAEEKRRNAEAKQLELERIATTQLSESEINLILEERNSEVLLALASNPKIDIRWIEKLINCHHIKGSRQIREVANENIRARQS